MQLLVVAKFFLPTHLRQGFGTKLLRCKQRQLRTRPAQPPQRPGQAAATAVHAAEVGLALGDGRQAAVEGRPGGIRNDLGRQVGRETTGRNPRVSSNSWHFFGKKPPKIN